MEKIVIVVQGRDWAINAIDFACYLGQEGRSRVIGYFLEEPAYTGLPHVYDTGALPYLAPAATGSPQNDTDHAFAKRRMEHFLSHCDNKGILATAATVTANNLETIIAQTRFADLLVVDAAAVPGHQPAENIPSPAVQRILSESQCPVVIAPVLQFHPEQVIICYDGSPSSVFAMKQFAYILPGLSGLKATAVRIGDAPADSPEDIQALTTWMSRHFAFNEYTALEGSLEESLYPFILKHNKPVVVMGAYGRSALSRFFNNSSADYFISTLPCPIFITHL